MTFRHALLGALLLLGAQQAEAECKLTGKFDTCNIDITTDPDLKEETICGGAVKVTAEVKNVHVNFKYNKDQTHRAQCKTPASSMTANMGGVMIGADIHLTLDVPAGETSCDDNQKMDIPILIPVGDELVDGILHVTPELYFGSAGSKAGITKLVVPMAAVVDWNLGGAVVDYTIEGFESFDSNDDLEFKADHDYAPGALQTCSGLPATESTAACSESLVDFKKGETTNKDLCSLFFDYDKGKFDGKGLTLEIEHDRQFPLPDKTIAKQTFLPSHDGTCSDTDYYSFLCSRKQAFELAGGAGADTDTDQVGKGTIKGTIKYLASGMSGRIVIDKKNMKLTGVDPDIKVISKLDITVPVTSEMSTLLGVFNIKLAALTIDAGTIRAEAKTSTEANTIGYEMCHANGFSGKTGIDFGSDSDLTADVAVQFCPARPGRLPVCPETTCTQQVSLEGKWKRFSVDKKIPFVGSGDALMAAVIEKIGTASLLADFGFDLATDLVSLGQAELSAIGDKILGVGTHFGPGSTHFNDATAAAVGVVDTLQGLQTELVLNAVNFGQVVNLGELTDFAITKLVPVVGGVIGGFKALSHSFEVHRATAAGVLGNGTEWVNSQAMELLLKPVTAFTNVDVDFKCQSVNSDGTVTDVTQSGGSCTLKKDGDVILGVSIVLQAAASSSSSIFGRRLQATAPAGATRFVLTEKSPVGDSGASTAATCWGLLATLSAGIAAFAL